MTAAHRVAPLHVLRGRRYAGHLLRLERDGAPEALDGHVLTMVLRRGSVTVEADLEDPGPANEALFVIPASVTVGMQPGLWSFLVDLDGVPLEDGSAYVEAPLLDQVDPVDITELDLADLTVLERLEVATPGAPADLGPELVAAHVLSGHRVVTTDLDGAAVYADVGNPNHARGPFFLTTGSVLDGATFRPLEPGDELTEPGWSWVPRASLFLGVDGHLVATPPAGTFVVRLGVALEADRIYFDPATAIRTP